MIAMWDHVFIKLNPQIGDALNYNDGQQAFNLMHTELDKVWQECYRVLKPGGLACINIGDAVRTIKSNFQIFSNHTRIINCMSGFGFTQLPDILWRKQTNAPNKFMGSGMLPACAYVTYEHEYILIFRKGSKREFKKGHERENRRKSAFFWEERNLWFSDLWNDLKGSKQKINDPAARLRSAAFPFDLAYRLICMHSVYGDTILDPFLGTGTTTVAAISSGRNSIGIELEETLTDTIKASLNTALQISKIKITDRLKQHRNFIADRISTGKKIKYHNKNYDFGVITSHETDLEVFIAKHITMISELEYMVAYHPLSY